MSSSISYWWTSLVQLVMKMGCMLMKQTVVVEGVRYKILRELAEGGFSVIQLAESGASGKKVAVKRITCHSIEDQNVAKLEIQICRQINHENVIRLLGATIIGEADIVHNQTSEAILVMPYYERGSLQQELERRATRNDHMNEPTVLRLFHSICAAVREFHKSDPVLAHRDIKPHNVLLTKNFTPVLMDLGSVAVARIKIRSNRDAQFLQDTAAERCSMTYRAPELFQVPSDCDIDEKTDVWSLGCLLYAIMYFKSPFDSVYERGDSVALAVQSGNIRFPEAVQANYSSALKDLVTRQLNLDWNFRPSVDSLMESIDELLSADQHAVRIES